MSITAAPPAPTPRPGQRAEPAVPHALVIAASWSGRLCQGGVVADNLTHGLAGALLAQTGFRQRYGPAATVALVVGAELPDLDFLFALGGPVSSFVHHRGMTHSLLGAPGSPSSARSCCGGSSASAPTGASPC